MANSELVHVVERLPVLAIYIEEVDFPIPVRILSTNQKDLIVGDCEC